MPIVMGQKEFQISSGQIKCKMAHARGAEK